REPLPIAFPKSAIDDPDAPVRLARLLASPTYRLAEQDPAFLARDELRGARLALEYAKAEMTLEENAVASTIVLFGSTRLAEPAAARRVLADCEAAARALPDDPEAARRLATARRLVALSGYYDVAREFARLVSSDCARAESCDYVIMTGGGPGIMEAGNRGAYEAGRHSIGLNITLPGEQFPNPYITPELCLQFHYFGLRKLHFLKRARALVAFPGGYGTLDELTDALCLVQTRKIRPIPIVLVGEAFWRRVLDIQFLVDEGMIAPEDAEIVQYAETAEAIWRIIRDWNHD
ncbi:MAG TPA: TIGR00730 family Rossman fold protein, partial [Candidatus Limnocylindria bacterium]|nr:TIGR00730 family Rossman fold protein [Candidatus Limnocylindria bacterium]